MRTIVIDGDENRGSQGRRTQGLKFTERKIPKISLAPISRRMLAGQGGRMDLKESGEAFFRRKGDVITGEEGSAGR